jgi:hypothetical protein
MADLKKYKHAWYIKNRKRTKLQRKAWAIANPFLRKMVGVRHFLKRKGCAEVEIQKALTAWKTFDGICQACGLECSSVWVTDHDHIRLTFRGIIGDACNHALGKVQDNPERLRALAGYLERCR